MNEKNLAANPNILFLRSMQLNNKISQFEHFSGDKLVNIF